MIPDVYTIKQDALLFHHDFLLLQFFSLLLKVCGVAVGLVATLNKAFLPACSADDRAPQHYQRHYLGVVIHTSITGCGLLEMIGGSIGF
jgi:hypothetical protein